MKIDITKKRDTALSELAKTYEVVRDELTERMEDLAGRIDDLDARRLGGRAYSSARDLRAKVESKVDKGMRNSPLPVRRQPRRFPWALLVVGLGTAGLAWLLYDRRRRDMIQGRITQLGVRAQEQAPGVKNGITGAVDGVMGKVKGGRGPNEEALRGDVESAIAAGGGVPDGMQVAVEGRTVYLRGVVDSAVSDRAAARAQQVEGVAAVVNLTTVPATPAPATSTTPAARRA